MRLLPYVLAVVTAAVTMASVSATPASLEPETILPAKGYSMFSRSSAKQAEGMYAPRSSRNTGRYRSVGRRKASDYIRPSRRISQSLMDLFAPARVRRDPAAGDDPPLSVSARRKQKRNAVKGKNNRRAGTCSSKASSSSSRVAPSSSSTKTASASSSAAATAKADTSSTAIKKASSTSSSSTKTKATAKTTSTAAVTAKASTTSSTAKAAATSKSAASSSSSSMIMAGYYASWQSSVIEPEDVDWDKYDMMAFAFATPTSSGGVNLESSDAAILKRLVTSAHGGGAKVILSIGGWGSSSGFSSSVASDSMRSTFVSAIKTIYNKYNIDGIDIDWEYPNSPDAGSYSASDAKNFQTFLQDLRKALPDGAIMTAAVSEAPWISASGGTVSNVSRAAGALDYIMIMNYDVWGSSSSPGPNAPLANLCGNSTQPGASAAAAVKAWSAAGMPRSKMLLGSPFYGYVSQSSKTTLVQRRSSRARAPPSRFSPRYDATMTAAERRAVSQSSGQINFSTLVSDGVLKLSGSEYAQDGGYTKYWDDCSDTPYLANGNKVITYDDPDSLYDKAAFAKEAGLGGSSVWSIDGDVSSWALTDALRRGMGLS